MNSAQNFIIYESDGDKLSEVNVLLDNILTKSLEFEGKTYYPGQKYSEIFGLTEYSIVVVSKKIEDRIRVDLVTNKYNSRIKVLINGQTNDIQQNIEQNKTFVRKSSDERPHIIAGVEDSDGNVSYVPILLDSGAMSNIIGYKYLEYLGLTHLCDSDYQSVSGGVNGSLNKTLGVVHCMPINICGHQFYVKMHVFDSEDTILLGAEFLNCFEGVMNFGSKMLRLVDKKERVDVQLLGEISVC